MHSTKYLNLPAGKYNASYVIWGVMSSMVVSQQNFSALSASSSNYINGIKIAANIQTTATDNVLFLKKIANVLALLLFARIRISDYQWQESNEKRIFNNISFAVFLYDQVLTLVS